MPLINPLNINIISPNGQNLSGHLQLRIQDEPIEELRKDLTAESNDHIAKIQL